MSEILRHQAILLEHIVTDQRYYPDYYKVIFYGNFPTAIRDKRFIVRFPSIFSQFGLRLLSLLLLLKYRGYEWEKYGAFCERMLNKHSGAQLLKTQGEPPVDIKYGNDQYIQCIAVSPEPDRNLPVFTNPDVPLAVRTYYEHRFDLRCYTVVLLAKIVMKCHQYLFIFKTNQEDNPRWNRGNLD